MEAWEHIAPELPPEWSVENSGDMDYQQNWATRAADGTVTERGFCGREYAVEDCWEQFGTPRKRWAELIAVERVREHLKYLPAPAGLNIIERNGHFDISVLVFGLCNRTEVYKRGQGPTLCDAAWACIQALGGGE